MKIRLRGKKGQVDVIGAISGFILLIVAIVVGLLIVGELEESTIGDCNLAFTDAENTTSVANGTEQLWSVLLPNLVTGRSAKDGNLTVTYNATDGADNCSIYIGSHLIGAFTNVSPSETFAINADYFSNPLHLNYTNCGANAQNVTNSSVRYLSLTSCDYTADAYVAMDTTYDLNFTAMGLLPVIILIMVAVAVIGAVLALRRL